MTLFYFDENLPLSISKALQILREDKFEEISVLSTSDEFGRGVADEKIIPEIGIKNGIMITRDINIRKRKAQYSLRKKHNIGIIFIDIKGKYWDIVKTIIKHWEEIVDDSIKTEKTFAFELKSKSGFKTTSKLIAYSPLINASNYLPNWVR